MLASGVLQGILKKGGDSRLAQQYLARRWAHAQESHGKFNLHKYDLHVDHIHRNASVPVLYEQALCRTPADAHITSTGALAALSGKKTGRVPSEKRIVYEPSSANDVWWGPVNIKLPESSFMINRCRAIDFLNTKKELFVVDGYAGWDPKYRVKVRVICARPYHALFMRNMLIRPSEAELASFGEPDYVIYNAGEFPANHHTDGMSSKTSVALHLGRREMVILGTEYAGEMKKGIFTIMHYLAPQKGVLSLHASANEGHKGDSSLFFGLSGTGKTTLSADPKRMLIGDDEHCWSDDGVFNIEGGCYAKCVNLTAESEPDIYNAIRFGSVLENVMYDAKDRAVDYANIGITENTRCSYPIDFIPNAKPLCIGPHPKNIVFLTCDAFGVLPPVAKLTPAQAMYYFISGYTAKVAGTEVGVKEPQATFSACFGEAFLMYHPTRYAEMLAEKLRRHEADAWLVSTGWTGGSYGVGKRMSLSYTRAIIDAIHSGELRNAPTTQLPIFNLSVPSKCSNVPDTVLVPSKAWASQAEYTATLTKLGTMFASNFSKYKDRASADILSAAPVLPSASHQWDVTSARSSTASANPRPPSASVGA